MGFREVGGTLPFCLREILRLADVVLQVEELLVPGVVIRHELPVAVANGACRAAALIVVVRKVPEELSRAWVAAFEPQRRDVDAIQATGNGRAGDREERRHKIEMADR